MILSSSEINKIWTSRTAILNKIYICEDKSLYRGLSDGTLTRVIGNSDSYNKEILKQKSEVVVEEYNQQIKVEEIDAKLIKSETKQVEVDFGSYGQFENEFIINDTNVTTSSKIIAEVAYEAPTGKDLG